MSQEPLRPQSFFALASDDEQYETDSFIGRWSRALLTLVAVAFLCGAVYSSWGSIDAARQSLATDIQQDEVSGGQGGMVVPIYDAQLASSGDRLFVRNARGQVSEINLRDNLGLASSSIFSDRFCERLAVSPAANQLAAQFASGEVVICSADALDQQRVLLPAEEEQVSCINFSLDGRWLAVGTFDGKVLVWNAESGEQFSELQYSKSTILSLGFAPSGELFVSTAVSTDQWQLASQADGGNRKLQSLSDLRAAREIVVSQDGQTIAVTQFHGTVTCYDLAAGEVLWSIPKSSVMYRGLQFSPDGTLLTCATRQDELTLFDTRTGSPIAENYAAMGFVYANEFSPEGDLLYMACTSGTVHIWSVPNQMELGVIALDQPID